MNNSMCDQGPFFDIEYRRPGGGWRWLTRFHSDTQENAMKEFKQLQRDYAGHDVEVRSCNLNEADPTPLEQLAALL